MRAVSEDEIDAGLALVRLEHRWIAAAEYSRGELRAHMRAAIWPLAAVQPPHFGVPQAAAAVDQLVRLAAWTAINDADERFGREARKATAAGDTQLRAFLDLRVTIELGDDLAFTQPCRATIKLKHAKTVSSRAFASFNGALGERVRFRGDFALGGDAAPEAP